jgi:hypothetical protein
MSWRRFQVLLRCLSPQSHTVTRLQSDQYIGQKSDQAVLIEGAKNVDHWFEATFAK